MTFHDPGNPPGKRCIPLVPAAWRPITIWEIRFFCSTYEYSQRANNWTNSYSRFALLRQAIAQWLWALVKLWEAEVQAMALPHSYEKQNPPQPKEVPEMLVCFVGHCWDCSILLEQWLCMGWRERVTCTDSTHMGVGLHSSAPCYTEYYTTLLCRTGRYAHSCLPYSSFLSSNLHVGALFEKWEDEGQASSRQCIN